MEVFRSEIKVGLLILAAVILLCAGIFIASDIRTLWEKKKTFVLLFPYADGITKGSPVWYAGFEVGEVTGIQIAHEARDRIAVTVRVDLEARVRKDSRIDIRSLGMMGEKYVEITPGSSDSPELSSAESLEGKSAASLSEVIETGQQVALRLTDLIQETQGLVHEVRAESSIKDVIQNANGLLVELQDQAKNLKPLIHKLGKFSDSLDESGRHIKKAAGEGGKELTALLKEMRDTNRSLQKRLENVEGYLAKTLGQVDRGFSEAEGCLKGVRTMLSNNEQDINSLVRHLSETSRHLEALSEDLRAHPWKVVWKADGGYDAVSAAGTEQWREKGRIGPHGKE